MAHPPACGNDHLEVDPRQGQRRAESRAGRRAPGRKQPRRASRLADEPVAGPGLRDPREHLDRHSVQRHDPLRRAARHPGASLRSGRARRRDRMASLPPHHLAATPSGGQRRPRFGRRLHAEGDRHHSRTNRRRPGERDADDRHAGIPTLVRPVRLRTRRRDSQRPDRHLSCIRRALPARKSP